MKNRWTHSNKAIFNVNYHFVWCPKYRRDNLHGKLSLRLKELLYEKAEELEIVIENLSINGDHLHLFIKSTTTYSPHFIVQQLKGYSSRILRKEFVELLKMPTLWTRAYYCETIGHISENTVKKYIEDQKNK